MDLDKILQQLPVTVAFVIDAHSRFARSPEDRVRRHDGRTPYWTHPLWCMSMCLQEATLPAEIRIPGAQALALHDVKEDTTAQLPSWVVPEVEKMVDQMTYASSKELWKLIWERPPIIWLLTLFDKTGNQLDGTWMTQEKLVFYETNTGALLKKVEKEYGSDLNITKLARTILGLTAA